MSIPAKSRKRKFVTASETKASAKKMLRRWRTEWQRHIQASVWDIVRNVQFMMYGLANCNAAKNKDNSFVNTIRAIHVSYQSGITHLCCIRILQAHIRHAHEHVLCLLIWLLLFQRVKLRYHTAQHMDRQWEAPYTPYVYRKSPSPKIPGAYTHTHKMNTSDHIRYPHTYHKIDDIAVCVLSVN